MGIKADYLGMPLRHRRSRCREPRLLQALRRARLSICSSARLQSAALSADDGLSLVHEPEGAMGAGRGKGGRALLHGGASRHPAGLQGSHPYLVLLVDLDTQKGKPTEHEALRVVGNLTTPEGKLAPPEMVQDGSASARACAWCSPTWHRASPSAMDHRRGRNPARQALALSAGVRQALLETRGDSNGAESRPGVPPRLWQPCFLPE